MSDDQFKIQLSYKTGPNGQDMVNLRANTAEELKAELDLIEKAAGSIAAAGNLLRAGATVADAGIAAPPSQQPSLGQEAQAHAQAYGFQGQAQPAQAQPSQGFGQQSQQAPTGGPVCAHGPRVFKNGVSGKGPWAAWFCPLPKGTPGACDAQFVKAA